MFDQAKMSIMLLASAIAVVLSSAASGAKLDGEYLGTGDSFFEKLTFKSGGKVRVTFMGMTKVGTFEVEDNEVLITVGNETNVFTLDDQGCVVGGGLLGKYCKNDQRNKATKKPAKGEGLEAGSGSQRVAKATKLSGVYQAGNSDMSVSLDFKSDDKVRITVAGANAKPESRDAKYSVAGDRITIGDPDGGQPLVLTRKGNTLEGAPEGESMTLKFVKK
jgi:hypothetical protein